MSWNSNAIAPTNIFTNSLVMMLHGFEVNEETPTTSVRKSDYDSGVEIEGG